MRGLAELHLSMNELKEFPAGICNLPLLRMLNLSDNQIAGALPPLSGLRSLQHLDLSGNRFCGAVPPGLGRALTELVTCKLCSNSFSGAIPVTLLQVASLELLWLSHNLFSGAMPSPSQCGSRLHFLRVDNNLLSGSVPAWPPGRWDERDGLGGTDGLWYHLNYLTGMDPSTKSDVADTQHKSKPDPSEYSRMLQYEQDRRQRSRRKSEEDRLGIHTTN